MIKTPKILRSLLFVPATHQKFLESAMRRNADAIQLDLEDAIALSEKEAARQAAAKAIKELQGRCPYVVVRINASIRLAVRDLEAIVSSCMPKPAVEQHRVTGRHTEGNGISCSLISNWTKVFTY